MCRGRCDIARILPRRLCNPSRGHFNLRAVAMLGLSSNNRLTGNRTCPSYNTAAETSHNAWLDRRGCVSRSREYMQSLSALLYTLWQPSIVRPLTDPFMPRGLPHDCNGSWPAFSRLSRGLSSISKFLQEWPTCIPASCLLTLNPNP